MFHSPMHDVINFQFLIENNFSAKDIDLAYRMLLKDFINEAYPFIPITLKSYEEFLYMIPEANNVHILSSNNEFLLIAFYNDTNDFPVARSYFFKVLDLVEVSKFFSNYLNQDKNSLFGEHNYYKFLEQENGYLERIKKYLNSNQEKNNIIKELFDGRTKNTRTDFGFRISSQNCIFCGGIISHTVSTTIVNNKGLYFNYDVCSSCYQDMQKNDISPLNYFSRYFTDTDMIKFDKLTRKDILKNTKFFLNQELQCKIIGFNKKDTITAIRRTSGIKIIFRLTDILDYAYNFYENKACKEPFARIDSAKHHPELKFGPDHLHDSTIRESFNKSVKDSFTMGMPYVDKKAIIKLLETKELEIKKRAKP